MPPFHLTPPAMTKEHPSTVAIALTGVLLQSQSKVHVVDDEANTIIIVPRHMDIRPLIVVPAEGKKRRSQNNRKGHKRKKARNGKR